VQLQYQQYADDTQLHLAMHADNTAAGLSVHIRRQATVAGVDPPVAEQMKYPVLSWISN